MSVPRPPELRLSAVAGTYLFALLGPLAALWALVGCIAAQRDVLARLRIEDELARSGAAVPAEIERLPRKRGLLVHDYRLRVRFTDGRGERRDELTVFSSLGSEVDLTAPAQVHYDPGAPSRWVLSSARTVRLGRALLPAAWILAAGVLLALFVAVSVLKLRDLREARRRAVPRSGRGRRAVRRRTPRP